jgi:2-oxoglutarate dehydrogenase E2 component (dihydrolipoamide succinyltransferase)
VSNNYILTISYIRTMIIEIKVPSPGESVTEVEIGKWLVENGSSVKKGQEIAEVESDKATLTLVADEAGQLSIVAEEGKTVTVGSVVGTIDTDVVLPQPFLAQSSGHGAQKESSGSLNYTLPEPPISQSANLKISSVAREMMKEHQLSVDDLISGLKRIGKKEMEQIVKIDQTVSEQMVTPLEPSREMVREKMTVLRRKLSERLVAVKNETAMLTTFNEVDLSNVMEIRNLYQQKFSEKHGFKLGFMAFFTKAVAIAVQFHPSVNSMIEGEEIISPRYVDVGIAVQTPKGLMVPVVRNVESKSIPQIEFEIKELAEKARNKKITLEELSGGTISITNGGVFGSLLSTPILNPPQSAILGMHNIVERPVAINGKVEIRPMMYVALSYDHRVIDGKDSVGFLVRVKEMIENPQLMITSGKNPVELLLDI